MSRDAAEREGTARRRPTGRLVLALVALAVVALTAVGANWLRSSLGTCELLDRLLARSGCVLKADIPRIEPLGFAAMVPRDDGTVWLYGYLREYDPAPPARFVVDTRDGAVLGEGPLRFFSRTVYRLIPSVEGDRMAIVCLSNVVCDELPAQGRPQGYVLSIETGEVIEEIPTAFGWTFPGEPMIVLNAALLKDRALVAEPDYDTGGVILRRLSDNGEAGRLTPENPRSVLGIASTLAVRASPSGRFAAVINNASDDPGIGSRIDIWDIDEQRLLSTVTTDAAHPIDVNAAWSRDERHLLALEDRPGHAPGTTLYVFKLR